MDARTPSALGPSRAMVSIDAVEIFEDGIVGDDEIVEMLVQRSACLGFGIDQNGRRDAEDIGVGRECVPGR